MPSYIVRSRIIATDEDEALHKVMECGARWAMIDRNWKGLELDASEGLIRPETIEHFLDWTGRP